MRNHTYTEDLLILNLQLFAEGNTQTTGTNNEGNSLSVEMKEFYDNVLLKAAKPKLVHEQFAQKKPIPAGRGKTIEFRRFDKLPKVTEPLTEGVTPNGQTLNVTNVTATISQYGGYVEMSDLLDLTAIDDVLAETVELLGDQAGLTRDTVVRNEMAKTTNNSFAFKVGADGAEAEVLYAKDLDKNCKLKVKDIRRVATKMKRNNINPLEGGAYVMIVHPDVAGDLKNDPEYAEIVKYTDPKPIYEGELCKIENVRIVESSEALITRGDVTDKNGYTVDMPDDLAVYHCYTLGANAYGVTDVAGRGVETIIKQLGAGNDPLNQRSTAGWKTNLTAVILSDEALCDLMCCSSDSDTVAAN